MCSWYTVSRKEIRLLNLVCYKRAAQLQLLFVVVLVLVTMAFVAAVAVVFATCLSSVRSCLSQPQTAAPQDP